MGSAYEVSSVDDRWWSEAQAETVVDVNADSIDIQFFFQRSHCAVVLLNLVFWSQKVIGSETGLWWYW